MAHNSKNHCLGPTKKQHTKDFLPVHGFYVNVTAPPNIESFRMFTEQM